jgi:hypothetical protein
MAPKCKRELHLQKAGRALANKRLGIQKGPPACQSQYESVFLDFTSCYRDTQYLAMLFVAYFRWNVSTAMLAV